MNFRMLKVSGCLALVLVLGGLWGSLIEQNWIQVTEQKIFSPKLKAPFVLMHLSDLHSTGYENRERQLVRFIEIYHPDVIVITGDLLTNKGTERGYKDVLSHLRAPFGVFFVKGNWENTLWTPFRVETVIDAIPQIKLLSNASIQLREDLAIVGVEDVITGRPDLEKSLDDLKDSVFKIAIFHSPLFFDSIYPRVDLALAGHTHGGQIRIPFVRPFWLPKGSGNYLEGWYENGGAKLYVSRGVGTSNLPIRFNCRPEVVIFRFIPS